MKKRLPLAHREFGDRAMKVPELCGFDIETIGLGGPFTIGTYYVNDEVNGFFYSLDEFIDFVLDHPGYRYLAHNASGYEFAYFLPVIYERFLLDDSIEVLPTIQGENRVIQIRIIVTNKRINRNGKEVVKKTTIDLRDTLCLFNMSLEGVAKAFCPELPKLKELIDFEKEVFDRNNPEHLIYAMRDSEIVVKAYYKAAAQQEELFNSPLGLTAGATAMNAFQSTLPKEAAYWRLSPEVDLFVRQCYYGGLVLPGHKIGQWGATGSIDVNAAYAYQMKEHKMPIGTATGVISYMKGLIGFYAVIAHVPLGLFLSLGFNPVPKRDNEGLSWPSGDFKTFLSSVEIEYAQEKGVTFEILYGYVWTREEYVFTDFVAKCQAYELRDGGIYKPLAKLERNSLYGKFATKSSHNTIMYSQTVPTDTTQNLIPLTNPDNGDIIEGIYVGHEETDSPYMLPHWGALITAHQRVYLMGFIETMYARGSNSVYADTDSIKCEINIIMSVVHDGTVPIGNEYGQFKVEDICQSFTVIGGKCYYGTTAEGKVVLKAKGIPNNRLKPLAERVFLQAVKDLNSPMIVGTKAKRQETLEKGIEFVGVKSVISIIKENSYVRPEIHRRKITDIRNSWAWHVDEDLNIRPRVYTLEGEQLRA